MKILTLTLILVSFSLFAKGGGGELENEFNTDFDSRLITNRKSLKDAYYRWKKIYRPYSARYSPLEVEIANKMERLFSLADLAVVEKVVLLEVIGKIHDQTLPRDTIHKDYYEEILNQMKKMELKDKRLIRIRRDLIKAIGHHREVLMAWLKAAQNDEVHKVQNKQGRWVHPGTVAGDKIINNLYHRFVKKEFPNEYAENILAFERHFCVLIF